MNIIIPIGGIGKRFSDKGYHLPKPLIKSLGAPIIIRCINSLTVGTKDIIHIPYRVELDEYNFKDIITKEFDYNFKFIPINFDTRGAAETVLCALQNMSTKEVDDLTIVVDSDNLYNDNIINYFKEIKGNVIFYFDDKNSKPLFSYIKLDGDKVIEIKEKTKISNFACSGAYGFENGNILKEYITTTINNNDRSKNEFYISTIYQRMLDNDVTVKAKESNDYVCLGTPEQLKIHSSNINVDKKMRFCFDFDNTLVSYPKIKGDYSSVLPLTKNIKIVADVGGITLKTLEDFKIPYDEVYFGKPHADFYVDDLAIKSFDDFEKEMGFYDLHPEPRLHNKIEIHKDKIVKFSTDGEGEKYWYKNIPNRVKDMFPELLDHDENSITISRVNGLPLSHLNTNNILTTNILFDTLLTLKELHVGPFKSKGVNIYDNYNKKLRDRFFEFDYSKYEGVVELVNELGSFFDDYETNDNGTAGLIHGDPVLTNILIDNFENIRFIDMRGKVGDTLTTCGDVNYDYAKIYQSLIGYDYILMGKPMDEKAIEDNLMVFDTFITNNYDEDTLTNIKWITKSLLLTLIPLHNNDKCMDYYNLINKIKI